MPKTIIINEDIKNSDILREAIEFNQLPKHLRIEILRGKTPLSDNECFPYSGYLEKMLVTTYSEVSNNEVVKNGTATPNNVSKIASECQKIENPIKNKLEDLVNKTVTELFRIPIEKVDFSLEIVSSVDQSKTNAPFGPNEDMPAGLATIDDVDYITKEVTKRRFQNALIAGASRYFTHVILYNVMSSLDEINPGLYNLYQEYLLSNDYLIFASDIPMSEKDKHETGHVTVELGNEELKNRLKAEAVNFPLLVYETIKGFLEIFTAHGLPSNADLLNAVLSKSDYMLAEPWYIRFGYGIWESFHNVLKESGYEDSLLPYILMKVSVLEPDKYIRLMKEILAGTEKSKRVMKRVCDYARKKVSMSDFDDRMSTNRNTNVFMVNDGEKEII